MLGAVSCFNNETNIGIGIDWVALSPIQPSVARALTLVVVFDHAVLESEEGSEATVIRCRDVDDEERYDEADGDLLPARETGAERAKLVALDQPHPR